jgi:hypothetical protein
LDLAVSDSGFVTIGGHFCPNCRNPHSTCKANVAVRGQIVDMMIQSEVTSALKKEYAGGKVIVSSWTRIHRINGNCQIVDADLDRQNQSVRKIL